MHVNFYILCSKFSRHWQCFSQNLWLWLKIFTHFWKFSSNKILISFLRYSTYLKDNLTKIIGFSQSVLIVFPWRSLEFILKYFNFLWFLSQILRVSFFQGRKFWFYLKRSTWTMFWNILLLFWSLSEIVRSIWKKN